MSTKRKIIIGALLTVAVVAACVLAYKLTNIYLDKRDSEELREIAFETTVPTESTTHITAPTDISQETYPSVEVVYDSPVNFVELQSINPDIFAWIETAGGNISYPVLRNRHDFEYYLTHAYDNTESESGSIFTESFTRYDFSDPVTVVFGHNVWGGSIMFGPLNSYRNRTYLEENRTVTIYTPTDTLTYKIFATATYSNMLISSQYDITSVEGAQEFLASITEISAQNGILMDDVTISEDDHVLVLCTCNGNLSERFLVLAVLEDN